MGKLTEKSFWHRKWSCLELSDRKTGAELRGEGSIRLYAGRQHRKRISGDFFFVKVILSNFYSQSGWGWFAVSVKIGFHEEAFKIPLHPVIVEDFESQLKDLHCEHPHNRLCFCNFRFYLFLSNTAANKVSNPFYFRKSFVWQAVDALALPNGCWVQKVELFNYISRHPSSELMAMSFVDQDGKLLVQRQCKVGLEEDWMEISVHSWSHSWYHGNSKEHSSDANSKPSPDEER